MKRWLLRSLGIVGGVLIIQSVFWEYARMKPDYRFLVDPWSIRGFDTIHGAITASIGVGLLIAVLLVTWPGSTGRMARYGIMGYMVLAAVVGAVIFAREPIVDAATGNKVLDAGGEFVTEPGAIDIPLNFFVLLIVSYVATSFITILVRDVVKPRVAALDRTGAMLATRAASFVIIFIVSVALVGDSTLTLSTWLAVLIAMGVLAALSLLGRPPELAANRMLMAVTVCFGGVIGLSGGAIRSNLLRLQTDLGIPSEYKDTQVTWGYFLANIGVVLVFFGAVALWARRRDHIGALQRARRQREAAEQSAREIQEALEKATA